MSERVGCKKVRELVVNCGVRLGFVEAGGERLEQREKSYEEQAGNEWFGEPVEDDERKPQPVGDKEKWR